MTKQEFKELRDVCKKEWLQLSETGSDTKSDDIWKYVNVCPACEISSRTWQYKTKNKGCDDEDKKIDCRYCPISVWRNKALKDKTYTVNYSICDRYKEVYSMWRIIDSIDTRKKYALKISKMTWKWLPIYEKI